MKQASVAKLAAILALVASSIPAISASAPQSKTNHVVISPSAAIIGPRATPATVANPKYGLFTCQVGLTTDTCYDPYQIRHAYRIDRVLNAGFTGKGKTIVIVDAFQSPNIVEELSTFIDFYGLTGMNGLGNPSDPNLPTFTQIAPDGLTPYDPNNLNMFGWAIEISFDVEWAHAIAPDANIVLVLAKSDADTDLFSVTQYAVDHRLGDVISQSFGGNETCEDADFLAAQHNLFTLATRRHITLVASSGDQGAAQRTCDGTSWERAVSSPASDPLVLSIGGTELHAAGYCLTQLNCDPTANPAPGKYLGEVAWNEPSADFGDSATGGGYSVVYRKPIYQFAAVPFNKRGRGVPDVAYTAAGNFSVLTFLDIPLLPPGFYGISGTSVGTPQWGAIVSLADQKAGRSLGFVNASLYLFSLFPSFYSDMFHDITSGNNSVTELDSDGNPVFVQGFSAKRGWDATTGLGSPKADQVVSFLTFFTSDRDADDAIQNSDPENTGRHNHRRMRPH